MIKIKEYKITEKFRRGAPISLPKAWLDDQKLIPGMKLVFYRTVDDGLVIRTEKQEVEK